MTFSKLVLIFTTFLGLSTFIARAEPVVVELFTSQGCSSCPPADNLMVEIAKQKNILVLTYHVDYWNYLGWEDKFARPEFTARQELYKRLLRQPSKFTPQAIIGGQAAIIGHDKKNLMNHIAVQARQDSPVALKVVSSGGSIAISVAAIKPEKHRAIIELVEYIPSATVKIEAGENAGHSVKYVNIVRSIKRISTWDGRMPLNFTYPNKGKASAILVQSETGKILASARVR